MLDLIPKNITPVKLFSENGLDPVLKKIRKEIREFVPIIETSKGRKEIGSFAYKIAQSKTFIDKLGKELNADLKAKTKLIDAERKRSRDTLDKWKNEVRQPLTDYEIAEKERIEEEQRIERVNEVHGDALHENEMFDREVELKRKEAELERIEEERLEKLEKERQAKEQKEYEERLKKEAAETERREAEKKIQHEKDERERVECEALEAKEKAERDKIAAEERAKIEKEMAVQKAEDDAKAEAAKKERDRLRIETEKAAKEQAAKDIADKKATNKKHQANINNKIMDAFSVLDIPKADAKKIIIAVVQGKIPNLIINY